MIEYCLEVLEEVEKTIRGRPRLLGLKPLSTSNTLRNTNMHFGGTLTYRPLSREEPVVEKEVQEFLDLKPQGATTMAAAASRSLPQESGKEFGRSALLNPLVG